MSFKEGGLNFKVKHASQRSSDLTMTTSMSDTRKDASEEGEEFDDGHGGWDDVGEEQRVDELSKGGDNDERFVFP